MANKPETYTLELTAAIALDGEVVTKGNLVEVTAKEARNLLARGKAVLADGVEVPDEADDLKGMKVDELRQLADDAGIEGYRDMRKSELVAALAAAAGEAE